MTGMETKRARGKCIANALVCQLCWTFLFNATNGVTCIIVISYICILYLIHYHLKFSDCYSSFTVSFSVTLHLPIGSFPNFEVFNTVIPFPPWSSSGFLTTLTSLMLNSFLVILSYLIRNISKPLYLAVAQECLLFPLPVLIICNLLIFYL